MRKPKDTDHSKRLLYDRDIDSLKEFMREYQPRAVVVAPKSLKSQNLKTCIAE